MKTLNQQIIDFIDLNDGATYTEIKNEFSEIPCAMSMFEELLNDGQLRQVVASALLGTYKYHLAC
jgi:hypothetical protein